MKDQNDRKLLSAREICAELEISRKTLCVWVKRGKFAAPTLNERGRLYWDASALPQTAARVGDVPAEPKPIDGQELHSAGNSPVTDQRDARGGDL